MDDQEQEGEDGFYSGQWECLAGLISFLLLFHQV